MSGAKVDFKESGCGFEPVLRLAITNHCDPAKW
jgi:hypothetical protein